MNTTAAINYDIKIVGEDEDNGKIEFDRLAYLTKSTKAIAIKALMLNLRGYSDITPNKDLKKALHIYLDSVSGNNKDGTSLTIDCKNFSETIKGLQLDFFQPKEDILTQTPMSLVIKSFHSALRNDETQNIDKPLLKTLLNFKKNFLSSNEIFYLSNRGSIAEVKLTKDDFQKIEQLEESIPNPENVIVNGQLDEMKISKGRLGLMTENGLITLVANDESILHLVAFMGKEVTINGKAHYRPNGHVSFIEVKDFRKPISGDSYFSQLPDATPATQQVLFEMKQTKKNSSFEALKALSGLLKDEITDEKFKEVLKDLHR